MKLVTCFYIFLLDLLLNPFTTAKSFEVTPKQAECISFNKDFIANLTCSYKRLGWKKAKYSFDGYIKPGIQLDNLIYKGTAYRRESNMEYRIFGPKEYRVDICAFLKGTWTHIMVELVTAFMKRAAKENNLFHPCPFSGHAYFHDFIVDENSYSVVDFLPTGAYFYKSKVYTQQGNKEYLLVEIRTYVEILSVGINRD